MNDVDANIASEAVVEMKNAYQSRAATEQKTFVMRFRAMIDTTRETEKQIIGITLIDVSDAIGGDKAFYENFARLLTCEYLRTACPEKSDISYGAARSGMGLTVETEKIEKVTRFQGHLTRSMFSVIFRINQNHQEAAGLVRKAKKLEKENKALKKEIEELSSLLIKLEDIKESYRVPFDAIEDLVITFDYDGNVLVVNQASIKWFGQSPKDIVGKKKYKKVLKQDVLKAIRQVCDYKQPIALEEKIGEKMLQITYVPMVNKRTGLTQVVMLVQDITDLKKLEEERIRDGRNEGVVMMGGTIRHILNSSLTAILGFSQLALSTYQWPRETMVKYLRLIERTAQRMKNEISMIAEQKEYVTTKYIDIPDTDDCKEIIDIKYKPDDS